MSVCITITFESIDVVETMVETTKFIFAHAHAVYLSPARDTAGQVRI